MKADTTRTDGLLKVTVEGEINTITTPELAKLVENLSDVRELVFDIEEVAYISSAGLRLFLSCQRTMTASGGSMVILNPNEFVAEIFESVGYDRIMKLERKEQPGK